MAIELSEKDPGAQFAADPAKAKSYNRLRSYNEYCRSIALFLEQNTPNLLVGECISSGTFHSIRSRAVSRSELIRDFLWNSWYTEINLSFSLSAAFRTLYSSLWAPVQLYYSIFLSLQAFSIAKGDSYCTSNIKALNKVSEEIQLHPDLFPYPWKILCLGNPFSREVKYLNWPQAESKGVSTISARLDLEGLTPYTVFLRTSRKKLAEAYCDEYRVLSGKKRLSSADKDAISRNVVPTSFFHCLYRLQNRINFSTLDLLPSSLNTNRDAKIFADSMAKISWNTMLLLEILIAKHISRKNYSMMVNDFVRQDTATAFGCLAQARWDLFQNWW